MAVLQLVDVPPEKLRELKPVQLGTSSTLLVGQRVYAIGACLTCPKFQVAGALRHVSVGTKCRRVSCEDPAQPRLFSA